MSAERGNRLAPHNSSRLFWVLTRLRVCYADMIHKYLPQRESLVVVDYGCGNKPYQSLFLPSRYIGVDFTGNELADLTLLNDGRLPLSSGECDVVVSSQVLEHVDDVALYLSEARRVLKSGGCLFLSTHGVWQYHPDPGDYWRWTGDGLRKTLTEAGFEIAEVCGLLSAEAAALQLWQDSVSSRVPRRLRPAFFGFMQRRIRRADLRSSDEARAVDAGVYVVVARRRESADATH